MIFPLLYTLVAVKGVSRYEDGSTTINVFWHGLLESRTGNSNITVKKAKTDALILEWSDEIV